MKNSELFQKVYGAAIHTHRGNQDCYKNTVFLPEVTDELGDLEQDERLKSVLERVFDLTFVYCIEIVSSSVAQVLGQALRADADVDLSDPKVIEKLTGDFAE